LAGLASSIFAFANVKLPVPAALEELSIVAALLLLELGFQGRGAQPQPLPKHKAKETFTAELEQGGLVARLQALAKAGDAEAAEAVMEKILSAGHKPSLVCYKTFRCQRVTTARPATQSKD